MACWKLLDDFGALQETATASGVYGCDYTQTYRQVSCCHTVNTPIKVHLWPSRTTPDRASTSSGPPSDSCGSAGASPVYLRSAFKEMCRPGRTWAGSEMHFNGEVKQKWSYFFFSSFELMRYLTGNVKAVPSARAKARHTCTVVFKSAFSVISKWFKDFPGNIPNPYVPVWNSRRQKATSIPVTVPKKKILE